MTPTIAIYMHQTQPFHPMQMEAMGRHTQQSYRLILVHELGSVHVNLDRALQECDRFHRVFGSRYVVILDDDCIVLEDNWLAKLLKAFETNPRYGILTVPEMKNRRTVRKYLENKRKFISVTAPEVVEIPWIPGYLMAIDLAKVPGLYGDVRIPFTKGMSDLDLSLQVLSRGFLCGLFTRTAVYHPYKGPCTPEMDRQYEQQYKYMKEKWGNLFVARCGNPTATLINHDPSEVGLKEDLADYTERPDFDKKLVKEVAA